MKSADFSKLVASIKEAGQIKAGRKAPSRVHEIKPPEIRMVRERLRASQSEFALMIGVSTRTLQNCEQGRRRPEGPPQIEVTFDIDANGIVHVSAKDLGTGREQSIRITASSGLAEEEIKRMVKDAETHAADDKKRREVIEARNHLDTLIYTTEKSLKEYADKVDSSDKQKIEDAIAKAKKAMESNDLSTIKSAEEELTQTSHKLAEAMYAKASQGAKASGAGPEAGPQAEPRTCQEDVVDADFEDVKDRK